MLLTHGAYDVFETGSSGLLQVGALTVDVDRCEVQRAGTSLAGGTGSQGVRSPTGDDLGSRTNPLLVTAGSGGLSAGLSCHDGNERMSVLSFDPAALVGERR